MLIKMLRKDFQRNKGLSITLFIFVTLSALLVASGSNMITELTTSMNTLFTKSKAPHFVQMHAGEIDQAAIDHFAISNDLVDKQQTVEMLSIDGLHLFLDDASIPESTSVMDHYFVKQNESFDFLLNMANEELSVNQGEIAVPIYYMQQKNMKVGDKINIRNGSFNMTFTVVDFVRDIQMNPSIIHSKRFVVSETDLNKLKGNVGETEYLIEFLLTDTSKLSEFRNAYQSSNLPKMGPSIDHQLFKMLNAITDGIMAAVILFVSFLLSLIAILCLRFTILAAIEEDYREIGIMKAIGIGHRDIKRMYLLKYMVMTAVASFVGFVASLMLNSLFTANITLYFGHAEKGVLLHSIPFIAVILLFLMVMLICMRTLKVFKKISAVEALRSGKIGDVRIKKRVLALPLHKSKWLNVPVFLGLRDVLGRFHMYRLLLFVFIIGSFIILVPLHLVNTMQSSAFNTYMGIERSDLRIDLQYSDNIMRDHNRVSEHLTNDEEVERFSSLLISSLKMVNEEGVIENITVESGDFSIFPLDYLKGVAPAKANEMALSFLNGKEMNKGVGDQIRLVINGQEQVMTVSGIYQDVTNGGRTAKAVLPVQPETVLRYEAIVDVKPHINIVAKTKEYEKIFQPARVTDLEGYLTQTLGNTIKGLKLLATVSIVIAILVSILITSLFLRMIVAKDSAQIAIMKSIGFSLKSIRLQYVTRALVVLGIGIVVGTLISNTWGQSLAGVMLSFMGAAKIEFEIDPVQAYIICPLVLMIAVTAAAYVSMASMKKTSITQLNAE
ncbi:FtsX-like permease family protein [Paenibacillus sp. GSMTC-2017]|uniref:ABC transporter permease n=1 Tax=Paenibacillus sp. GSMTC-2017 TaxID=2794350 RepID=UPI0018D67095|nr:FtsX-like permease family protein [Paenibacillus sp. GSMTC-2017]MBH5318372.1 FtsX-like permease family protein [Paenibacillus sp. GSMTC-2017]